MHTLILPEAENQIKKKAYKIEMKGNRATPCERTNMITLKIRQTNLGTVLHWFSGTFKKKKILKRSYKIFAMTLTTTHGVIIRTKKLPKQYELNNRNQSHKKPLITDLSFNSINRQYDSRTYAEECANKNA